ncbi:MAG: AarF/ABC1/UbiB kinase family protein [Alphaproteobacteria bacterium]|nr:AarF/ABC1/UbiB kinase family protein [Alphaproteobacteria bacterium]
MADRNSFGGRLRRYAQVSTTVGGLAARVAGGRLFGVALDQDRHAAELRAALGGMKGPLMKVAQMLSTIPDALPDAYVRELQSLQAHAPAMGWPFVRRRMTAELGEGWQQRFRRFEREAARAASLGQVHRAESLDGVQLACKLQYPDMASAVEADLRQLRLAFAIYQRYDRAVTLGEIHAEITARLREELDYRREARHLALYRAMLKDEAGVHVPDTLPELSTDRLLTMTWLDGVGLATAEDAPVERRNRIARHLFQAWYVPFYRYGVIHGDPHLGNYTLRPDDGVNLLDFGCVRVFRPAFVEGVIDLYKALRDDDEALAVHAYESWGFVQPSKALVGVMNEWARFLYAPLLADRVQPIQAAKSGLYGAEVASRVHRELRKLGGVTPPREFVLMDRAAIGLGSVFMRLGAELNWHRLFHGLVDDFDRRKLERRQARALKAVGLEASE